MTEAQNVRVTMLSSARDCEEANSLASLANLLLISSELAHHRRIISDFVCAWRSSVTTRLQKLVSVQNWFGITLSWDILPKVKKKALRDF